MAIISDVALNQSAQKFRKELLVMQLLGLGKTLPHVTLRTGIRYAETVGELSGDFEMQPYEGNDDQSDGDGGIKITPRTLYTHLGKCVKLFDPNKLISSIYGSSITSGKGLEGIPMNKAIVALMMKKLSKSLNKALFCAKRNSAGVKTIDLFNGWDTIAAAEELAGNLSVANGNFFLFSEIINATNAVDALKAFYRSSSDELQEENSKLFLPKWLYNAYCEDYKTTTGSLAYNKEFKKTYLEGSDDCCELVPLVSKKNSDYIQHTVKGNMLIGVNHKGEEDKIEVRRGNDPFQLQFVTTSFWGTEYESISPETLNVAKLFKSE